MLPVQVLLAAAVATVVPKIVKFGPVTSNSADENSRLRQACAEAKTLLDGAAKDLRKILDDELIIQETPIEASNAMELTAQAIAAACRIFQWPVVPKRLPRLCPTRVCLVLAVQVMDRLVNRGNSWPSFANI